MKIVKESNMKEKFPILQKKVGKLNEKVDSFKVACKNTEILSKRIKEKTQLLKNCNAREYYQKVKKNALRKAITDLRSKLSQLNTKLQEKETTILTTRKEKNGLLEENCWLHDLINDNKAVETFSDGKYTSDMQKCMYKLLECHVSHSKIESVIEAVTQLLNTKVTKVPKKPTVHTMNIQRPILAQK